MDIKDIEEKYNEDSFKEAAYDLELPEYMYGTFVQK